jgi:hypothetical protein
MLKVLNIPVEARHYINSVQKEEGLEYVLSKDEIIQALTGHAAEEEDEDNISEEAAFDAAKSLIIFCQQRGGSSVEGFELKLREFMKGLKGIE